MTGQVLSHEHDIVYELRDVVMVYAGQQERANDGISLDIRRGEIFGILGDNGAGKTTLVRQMVNLLQPTSGSIRLFGRPVADDPFAVTTRVGFMPQDGAVLDSLTVGEILFVTARLRGESRSGARNERDRLIDLWQLTAVRRRPCRHLSGGQLRLVQLALATANTPPVVILDEPTANLDPQRRQLVWKNLRQLNREQGTTVIFITHDAVEAEKIIERVAILRAGRVVAIGEPASLKRRVDRQVRLELEAGTVDPPALGAGLRFRRLPSGRWLALVPKDQLSEVLQRLDLERYQDFRIYSSMVVLGMAAPLLSITMLGILIRDSGVVALEYVLVGNVVLALMFENQNKVSSNFAYMRAKGTLRFVATLPVYKSALIVATVIAFLLLALPAVVVTIAAGSRILGVALAPSPWVLLVVPLCAIPLASIGALVGSMARTPEEAGSVSLLLTLLLLSLGPVLVPPERLPEALNLAGYASPATYAASALRQVLLGPVSGRLALDLGVLAGLSVAVLWFVERRLRWRVG